MAYTIRRGTDLAALETGHIALYPWGGEYRPDTLFKIGWMEEAFAVYLRSYEENPYVEVLERNGNVCRDSCMEFFFSPSPDNGAGYFNFEMNANPTLLLHYGIDEKRESRRVVDWPLGDFDLTVTKKRDDFGRMYWQARFTVPFTLIRAYVPGFAPKSGDVIRANLYKCGSTRQPSHYGVWSPFDTGDVPRPNFHVPRYFGEMTLE